MTHNDFMTLVACMREAQKAFFRNRERADLETARKLERIVDNEITLHEYGAPEPLFANEADYE